MVYFRLLFLRISQTIRYCFGATRRDRIVFVWPPSGVSLNDGICALNEMYGTLAPAIPDYDLSHCHASIRNDLWVIVSKGCRLDFNSAHSVLERR
jgi:hypothetical protein